LSASSSRIQTVATPLDLYLSNYRAMTRRLAEAGRSAEQHEADILRGIELRIDLGAFNQFHRRSRWGQSRRKGGGRTAGCRDIGHR
jgi:hypothetical protein